MTNQQRELSRRGEKTVKIQGRKGLDVSEEPFSALKGEEAQ